MTVQRKKIGLIGAGQIGGTMGFLAALRGYGDIALVDIAAGTAAGKALDILEAAPILNSSSNIVGGDDYSLIEGSDVIIVTAGLPRKPGMSRDDLLDTNVAITKSVAENVKKYAPDALVIMVTNPLDAMVYTMYKVSGLPANRVVGMAGVLDSARFRAFLAMETGISVRDISAMVLGGHGDTMVPVLSSALAAGEPIANLIAADRLEEIVTRTRKGGGEIVNLLGNGSAFYAPGTCALEMAQSFLLDEKRLLPCAALLNGEYGYKDVFVGVPAVIGADGVEEIKEFTLLPGEKAALDVSVAAVEELIGEVNKRL